jgi:hypothetical protein
VFARRTLRKPLATYLFLYDSNKLDETENLMMKKCSLYSTDLTDYSHLPNGLVSMLIYFTMSGADKDYIPMFSSRDEFVSCCS